MVTCPKCNAQNNPAHMFPFTVIYMVSGKQETCYECLVCKHWFPVPPVPAGIIVSSTTLGNTAIVSGNTVTMGDNRTTEPMFPVPKKEKQEDRFPHRCPKCNRKCYLGLNQIEHEVEGYCR